METSLYCFELSPKKLVTISIVAGVRLYLVFCVTAKKFQQFKVSPRVVLVSPQYVVTQGSDWTPAVLVSLPAQSRQWRTWPKGDESSSHHGAA